MCLNWNAQLGATYQVQRTTNFTAWNNIGLQFAFQTNLSFNLDGGAVGYYRVMLLRQ
jgi:hypothetical protein